MLYYPGLENQECCATSGHENIPHKCGTSPLVCELEWPPQADTTPSNIGWSNPYGSLSYSESIQVWQFFLKFGEPNCSVIINMSCSISCEQCVVDTTVETENPFLSKHCFILSFYKL